MNVDPPVKTSALETGTWTGKVSVAEAERIANTIRASWDLPSTSDPPSEVTDPSIEILDSSITRLPVEKAARNPYVWGLVGGVLLLGGIGIWMSRGGETGGPSDGADSPGSIAPEPAARQPLAAVPSATTPAAPTQAATDDPSPHRETSTVVAANVPIAPSPPTQPVEPSAVNEAAPPPPPVRVSVRVSVRPASARLELDGARVPSPYRSQIDTGRRLVFSASAPGYERLERAIDATSDVETVLALVAIPPSPRPPVQAQRPRPVVAARPRPAPTKVQRPPTGRNSSGATTFSSDNPYDE